MKRALWLAQLNLARQLHSRGVKEAGGLQGFGAEQLIDPARPIRADEALAHVSADHGLGALGDRHRQHTSSDAAEQIFVGPAPQLVMRRQAGTERDDMLIKEGIAPLGGGKARCAISLSAKPSTGLD
jgi:hypothetical protein